MHDFTLMILRHISSKNDHPDKLWHIGLTDDPRKTKKEFQTKYKIVCEYFDYWHCKNKTEAKRILKEIEDLNKNQGYNFTICEKTPKPMIFIFLRVEKKDHKYWKILNAPKPKETIYYIR